MRVTSDCKSSQQLKRSAPNQISDRRLYSCSLGTNPWWWLLRQFPSQLGQQDLLVFLRLGVATEYQLAPVGRRKMRVHHLDSRKLFQHRSRGESARQFAQMSAQRHRETIRQERHENVRLHSALFLMKNRSHLQVILQQLEGAFDLYQLQIIFPKQFRIGVPQMSAQQISAFAPPPNPVLGAAQLKSERARIGLRVLGPLDVHQVKDSTGLFLGLADSQEQFVMTQFLFALLQRFEPLEQFAQFAQADAPFFFQPVLALDEHVKLLLLRQQFDSHLRARALPRQVQQLPLQFG